MGHSATRRLAYLSLGCNLERRRNAAAMVRALCRRFGPIGLFPFCFTEPENFANEKRFLNSLAIVPTELSEAELKQQLNQLEAELGRDRSLPNSSSSDRTADLDILLLHHRLDPELLRSRSERYVHAILNGRQPPVPLDDCALPATEGPATVDLDRRTGDVRILEQGLDRLINR